VAIKLIGRLFLISRLAITGDADETARNLISLRGSCTCRLDDWSAISFFFFFLSLLVVVVVAGYFILFFVFVLLLSILFD
jgi:hypothetical protein